MTVDEPAVINGTQIDRQVYGDWSKKRTAANVALPCWLESRRLAP